MIVINADCYVIIKNVIVLVFIHSSMALQPFVGPWPLFQFRNPVYSRYNSLNGGSARRKAATYTYNKSTKTSMPRVEFEPMTIVFERAKTVHALHCEATVNGLINSFFTGSTAPWALASDFSVS
jgi:hypothetical protein